MLLNRVFADILRKHAGLPYTKRQTSPQSRMPASSSLIFACTCYCMRSGGVSALTILLYGGSPFKSGHVFVFYPMARAGNVFMKIYIMHIRSKSGCS